MSYTYLDFKGAVNEQLKGKITSVIDIRAFLNRSVRLAKSVVDFKSMKKTSQLSPGVYSKVYTYPAPADLKEEALIDLKAQVNRIEEFYQTTPTEFDQRKEFDKSMLAVKIENGVKFINASTELSSDETILNECESLTSNGTWVVSGDATNLTLDTVNFINGSASLNFDLNTGATTATIGVPDQTGVDLTGYDEGAIFVSVYIPLTTLLTSFTLKWGTDSSNYWTATVTTTHEGLAFYTGWNLLRFNWPATDTGTPDITDVKYVDLVINKTALMAASTDWRIDYIVARTGIIHDIVYYSDYAWKTNAGVAIENSTADTDVLVLDGDEFDLTVKCAVDQAGKPARLEVVERNENRKDWIDSKEQYVMQNPSERMPISVAYHRFASIEGDNDTNITNLIRD